MAGWFVSPQCGFSLSLVCNYTCTVVKWAHSTHHRVNSHADVLQVGTERLWRLYHCEAMCIGDLYFPHWEVLIQVGDWSRQKGVRLHNKATHITIRLGY